MLYLLFISQGLNGFIVCIVPIPNSINIQVGISFIQVCLTSISFSLANSEERHSNNIRDMEQVDSKYS